MKHIKAGARGLPTIEGFVFQLQSKFEAVTILGRHGGACSRFLLEFASWIKTESQAEFLRYQNEPLGNDLSSDAKDGDRNTSLSAIVVPELEPKKIDIWLRRLDKA